METKFSAWLKSKGENAASFALRCKLAPNTIRSALLGKELTLRIIKRIIKTSKGELKIDDFHIVPRQKKHLKEK